jgi:hypothetical protein
MSISGFTFLRNANKLYYPVLESINSILDLVDEFVIAVGQGDEDDNTLELLSKISSDKIKIIHTVWDLNTYGGGSEYAHQTDIAKSHCTGDWLFYLQGDEVIHENDISVIKEACEAYQNHKKIEGFVFKYLHFFGDYEHYFHDHCWYRKEIRIIRNLADVHSWKDAQSFRVIPNFEGNDYFRKEGTRKLNCKLIEARIFHYGWVRPPWAMKAKSQTAQENYGLGSSDIYDENFDYGRLDYCKVFEKASHPAVMQQRIKELDWENTLRFSGPTCINRPIMKHEKTKYRVINFIEKKLLGERSLGGFNNFKLV